MTIWDGGQLIAMGVVITVVMNLLSEIWRREEKGTRVNRSEEAQRRLLDDGGDANDRQSAGSSRTSYPMISLNGGEGKGHHGSQLNYPVTLQEGWYHR